MLGFQRRNGTIIGLILVMVDKNVGIILILFGDLLQKLGMQELFVLVVEVLFYVLFYVLSQKEQLMCILFFYILMYSLKDILVYILKRFNHMRW